MNDFAIYLRRGVSSLDLSRRTNSLTVVRKVSFHSSQSSFMLESCCIIVERSIACKAERRPSKSSLRKSKTDRFSLGPALIDVFRSKIITERSVNKPLFSGLSKVMKCSFVKLFNMLNIRCRWHTWLKSL